MQRILRLGVVCVFGLVASPPFALSVGLPVTPFAAPANDAVAAATTAPTQRGNHCIVSVIGVAFANYNPHSPTPNDSQGSVTVRCRGGQARFFAVQIDAGTSGRISRRAMQGPGGTVQYNLYLDATRQKIWGDGSDGSRTLRRTNIQNRTITEPIFGRVPPGQAVATGTYQDTLVVTVVF